MNKILFNFLVLTQGSTLAFGTVFYDLDTTETLVCTFSDKFQNRVLVERGKIQKVISADEEKLSIFIEEITGQAFVYVRDSELDETTISVITEQGLVQDLHLIFKDRPSEVISLRQLQSVEEKTICTKEDNQPSIALNVIEEIMSGKIPEGYFPSSIECQHWKPKQNILLSLINKFEGNQEDLYVYRVSSLSKKTCELMECELQFEGSRWIFLETNTILPKQNVMCVIAVKNVK